MCHTFNANHLHNPLGCDTTGVNNSSQLRAHDVTHVDVKHRDRHVTTFYTSHFHDACHFPYDSRNDIKPEVCTMKLKKRKQKKIDRACAVGVLELFDPTHTDVHLQAMLQPQPADVRAEVCRDAPSVQRSDLLVHRIAHSLTSS